MGRGTKTSRKTGCKETSSNEEAAVALPAADGTLAKAIRRVEGRRPPCEVVKSFRGITGEYVTLGLLTSLGLLEPQAEECLKVCRANFLECWIDLARVTADQLMSMGLDSAHAHLLVIQVKRFMKIRERGLLKVATTPEVINSMLAIDSSYTQHIADILWTVYIENMYDLLNVIATKRLSFDVVGMDPIANATLFVNANAFMHEYCFFQDKVLQPAPSPMPKKDVPIRKLVPIHLRANALNETDAEGNSHPTWKQIRPPNEEVS